MERLDRRTFLAGAAVTTALASAVEPRPAAAASTPVFLSTWQHGAPANTRAAEVFAGGGSLLDAVERGINVPENDPNVQSVGYGGLPNAEGQVELDAGIMDGTRHRAGAVCCLRDIKNPISVARLVMEKTRHTTLAGEGARRFAIAMGFAPEQLLTAKSLEAWRKWKADPKRATFWLDKEHHDTIGMVAAAGTRVVAGCSTSGLAWKIPGRVGDSPLVGCGFYADDDAGAASATGDGDIMTNYCTSMYIVMKMLGGMHPQEACEDLMRFMARTNPATKDTGAGVIAIDPRGEIGAASMNRKSPLQYALWRDGQSTLHEANAVFA